MVTRQTLEPAALGPALGYSHGIQAGQVVYVAGQIGGKPREDGRHDIVEGGLVPQFETALEHVATVVAEAGGRPEDVVEMTVFVTDIEAYRGARREIGQAWRSVFGKHYPAMTLVEVAGLFEPDAAVEVRAIAVLEEEA